MSDAPTSDIRTEAERWFARLRAPDCTASERVRFERWQAVPAHADAFAATEKLWASFGGLAGRADFEALSQQVLLDTSPPARSSWPRFAIAASILLAVVGGVTFWALNSRTEPAVVYSTGPGERSTVRLPDGSQVTLNFATELDAQFDGRERRITLRKGEALFAVTNDARRAFRVSAGDGEVSVLGTRFQVRNEDRRVAVTLLEGRVAVERKQVKQHVQLQPGDQVSFAEDSSRMARRVVDPEVAASWVTGRLLFRATPLTEAVAEVNRYTDREIRIGDPAISNIPISGTFEVSDSDSVLSALEALLPVRVERGADGGVTLQRR